MAGSTYGTAFSITTWGESHGPAIGAVIDGCPAGLTLSEEDIQRFLDRRKPGQNKYTTARNESDKIEILSGIFEGKTTGTPISLLVRNQDQRSRDYGRIRECYRPGHADYTFDAKYGFRDYRGGGRSSGRETIGRVAAGAVASRLLQQLGIRITAYTKAIGNIEVPESDYDYGCILTNPLYMPNNSYAEAAADYLDNCIHKQDSSGGMIECVIDGMPAGVGEPVFNKLDANLARAVMSIGAVKGVEIGDGFAVTYAAGSSNNDAFYADEGHISKKTNHAGGTLGGISDGSRIILRAAVKPTPSISQEQETVDQEGKNTSLIITGRHDPVIVPRAVVVVESMAAVTIADLLIANLSSRMEYLEQFYQRYTHSR
ncbi:MAG: chorismate synthase [Dorea sp.]|nr:chorismate synthase [Dorea sp.]